MFLGCGSMNVLKEHDVNKLDNFICGWYDEDMVNMSDRLIDHYNSIPDKKPGVIRNYMGQLVETPNVKSSIEITLFEHDIVTQDYYRLLQKAVTKYVEKYPWCNKFGPWAPKQHINLQHYKPGDGFYAWHSERTSHREPSTSRHLVFMTYLNDVTDGGETEFFHQKVKIKPEKGLTIVWPADWTFTHRGITSLTQDKFIATGWFNYVEDFELINV